VVEWIGAATPFDACVVAVVGVVAVVAVVAVVCVVAAGAGVVAGVVVGTVAVVVAGAVVLAAAVVVETTVTGGVVVAAVEVTAIAKRSHNEQRGLVPRAVLKDPGDPDPSGPPGESGKWGRSSLTDRGEFPRPKLFVSPSPASPPQGSDAYVRL
jgi:uncharacterized membrane protein